VEIDGLYWTWMSGSSEVDQNGIYGDKGIPSQSNIPGSRDGSISWVDNDGSFWIMGGIGIDIGKEITQLDQIHINVENSGFLNDLWRYNGNWTWISGSNTVNQNGNYGTKGEKSPDNIPPGRYISSNWIDNEGNFWLF
jgi:hypothetical protein